MLDRKLVLEMFQDRYYQPYFGSRVYFNGEPEWNISGLGFLTENEMVDLVVAAQPPTRSLYQQNWWQRLIKQGPPEDEIENRARHHVWLIRQQCLSIVNNRHEFMKQRFKAVGLLQKFMKEARRES